jgi:hypothetical protein
MDSRDISFILGEHHPDFENAVIHHRHRTGFTFEVATIHESIGEEVIALWFDRTPFVESLRSLDSIDLRVRGGVAATESSFFGGCRPSAATDNPVRYRSKY